jgi:hypothetical protein
MKTKKLHTRGDRKIMQHYQTLWSKTDIRILVYFKKHKVPSTYMEICRAYVKSNYATFKKACEDLKERGYLSVDSEGKYLPTKQGKITIEKGYDTVAIPFPYFDSYLKEVK